MIVYVVCEYMQDEGAMVLGVFSKKEYAEKYMKDNPDGKHTSTFIEECIVDKEVGK